MITFVRDDTNGYEINYGLADVNDICNKEKKFPAEWITADGTDISDEYIKYVRPLIQGTNIAEYSDGVPVHLSYLRILLKEWQVLMPFCYEGSRYAARVTPLWRAYKAS